MIACTHYRVPHFGHHDQQNLSSGFLLPQKLEIIDFFLNTVVKYCRHFGDKVEFENPSWTICVLSLFTTNDEYAHLCYGMCHIPDV